MAINTGTATAANSVAMMGARVVGLRFVALGAHAIAFCNEFIAVRVVTVATDNARLRHFALHKRAVYIDLIANLSVMPIEWCFKY